MKLQHNHTEMRIARIWEQCEGVRTFELDGEVGAKAGQFVMALIPGVSENPFTVAYDRPLRITAKVRGEDDGENSFTNQLFRMRKGNTLQITGPMGNSFMDMIDTEGGHYCEVYVIAGGCGAAGLTLLDKNISEAGMYATIVFGAKKRKEIPAGVIYELSCKIATEDGSFGVEGTVLDAIGAIREGGIKRNGQAIVCGPRKMIIVAAEKLKNYINPDDIIISVEPYMKCGRGVCGSCEVKGYHACTDGPNFRYSDIMDAPDFSEYRRGKSGALEPI